MKTNVLRNIALAAAIVAALAVSAQPKLKWLEITHDFGAFNEEMGPVTCTFKAVNVGSVPVTVLKARANCGCTRPVYPKTPVQPGDTLEVTVSYDPSGRPGKFNKQIRVESNATTANLLIRGVVIGSPTTLATRYPTAVGNARLGNTMTPFGQAVKGRVLSGAINVYNAGDHPIKPAVDKLPPYVHAIFRPEVIGVGEQGIVSLTAYTDQCPDYGVITDSFLLIPDSENAPSKHAKIATTVIVTEDFTNLTPEQRAVAPVLAIDTPTVDFGHLTPGKGTESLTFTISNTGKRELIVRRIYTADPAVDIKLSKTKIAPGKSAKVKVIVDRSKLLAPNPLNARITILANSPTTTSTIVRVVGEVD